MEDLGASKGITEVLLKNTEGALPLSNKLKRVAVLGPQARATTIQGGGSAWGSRVFRSTTRGSRVHPSRSPSILDALQTAFKGLNIERLGRDLSQKLSQLRLVHEAGCLLGERPTKNPELEGLKRRILYRLRDSVYK